MKKKRAKMIPSKVNVSLKLSGRRVLLDFFFKANLS